MPVSVLCKGLSKKLRRFLSVASEEIIKKNGRLATTVLRDFYNSIIIENRFFKENRDSLGLRPAVFVQLFILSGLTYYNSGGRKN